MPTLSRPLADGIVIADCQGTKAVLFDTLAPRWWIVDQEEIHASSTTSLDLQAFAAKLRSGGKERAPYGEFPTRQYFYVIYKLTDKCNYSCTYCYDRNFTRARDDERRNRTVREYLSRLNAEFAGAAVSILFHGGEPLLALSAIEDLFEFASTLTNIHLAYSIQSNASLLSQQSFDLLESHHVGFCFSVDGVESADNLLRVNQYNPNCYDLVRNKIDAISGLGRDSVGLLLTIGAHNVDSVCRSILRAQEDGFRSVSFSFMHELDRNAVAATTQQLVAMYRQLIAAVERDELSSLAVWPLIEWITKLTFGRSTSLCSTSPCGAGRGLIAILPSGELSPCDSLFSEEFIFPDLGAYERGKSSSSSFSKLLSRRTDSLVDCASCDVRRFCNGTCPGSAVVANGHVESINESECSLQYQLIKEMVWLLSSPQRSDKLLGYARIHFGKRRDTVLGTA